jgi:hypothetical protein
VLVALTLAGGLRGAYGENLSGAHNPGSGQGIDIPSINVLSHDQPALG